MCIRDSWRPHRAVRQRPASGPRRPRPPEAASENAPSPGAVPVTPNPHTDSPRGVVTTALGAPEGSGR
eukprot:534171-Pyramimonas_sp.AAC.1